MAFPRFLGKQLAAQCVGKAPGDPVFPGPDGGYLRSVRAHEDNYSCFAAALKAAGAPRITRFQDQLCPIPLPGK